MTFYCKDPYDGLGGYVTLVQVFDLLPFKLNG
jgi:hypothetical protein